MQKVEREAKTEGPAAVAELRALRERFRLARRFAEPRPKRKWTRQKLAEKTGLDPSEISNIESGQANPTYRTLPRLSAALDGKIDLVLG